VSSISKISYHLDTYLAQIWYKNY